MTPPVVAVIGTGNMGSSLIGGLIKDGHPPDKLFASDPSEEKLRQLQARLNIHTTTNNLKACQSADVVIFAVKPQVFAPIASELANVLQSRKPLVISIAAGVREEVIQGWLGGGMSIVRTMPNTPALIGCGATALYANRYVTHEARNQAESILRAVGIVVWLEDEKWMDLVTALSGSGPAYFFLVMEALQQASEELGLSADIARLLTLQTALGAARMAIESDTSLQGLRRQVTSPGGTTEKAISVLEENKIRDVFKKALQAAEARSKELADILGRK